MGTELFDDCKIKVALHPVDFDTDVEGELVDVTGYTGRAIVILQNTEDASQAATEKLDVGIHNVTSDAEAPSTSNLVSSFTQIVGSNNTASVVESMQVVELDLDALDADKPYIQLNAVETNSYECVCSAVVVLGGSRYRPESN